MAQDTTQLHIDPAQHGGPESAMSHEAQHGAAAVAGQADPKNTFTDLLGSLGDHREFSFAGLHVPLPVIFYDNGSMHMYSSLESMKAEGLYTEHHHKLTDASTLAAEHPRTVDLDLSVTNLVAFQWIAMILVILLGTRVAARYKKNPMAAPSGLQNAWEAVVIYLRDQVIYPNIPVRKAADGLMPYFLSLFFFILFMNLLGLIPTAHAATGAVGTTLGLALTAFVVVNLTAIRTSGIGAWFHHLLGGAPAFLSPIMVPIEIIGLFTKPFALTVRLFANMTAGHVVILSLVGLIFFFRSWMVPPVSIAFSLFIYTLELFVAFLQAYVFTILTAVFVGLAIGHGHHGHDEAHGDAHAH